LAFGILFLFLSGASRSGGTIYIERKGKGIKIEMNKEMKVREMMGRVEREYWRCTCICTLHGGWRE